MARVSKSKSDKKQDSLRLLALRKANDWTQRDLAKEFQVSHGAVAMWESGDRSIPGAVIKLIEIYERKPSSKKG